MLNQPNQNQTKIPLLRQAEKPITKAKIPALRPSKERSATPQPVLYQVPNENPLNTSSSSISKPSEERSKIPALRISKPRSTTPQPVLARVSNENTQSSYSPAAPKLVEQKDKSPVLRNAYQRSKTSEPAKQAVQTEKAFPKLSTGNQKPIEESESAYGYMPGIDSHFESQSTGQQSSEAWEAHVREDEETGLAFEGLLLPLPPERVPVSIFDTPPESSTESVHPVIHLSTPSLGGPDTQPAVDLSPSINPGNCSDQDMIKVYSAILGYSARKQTHKALIARNFQSSIFSQASEDSVSSRKRAKVNEQKRLNVLSQYAPKAFYTKEKLNRPALQPALGKRAKTPVRARDPPRVKKTPRVNKKQLNAVLKIQRYWRAFRVALELKEKSKYQKFFPTEENSAPSYRNILKIQCAIRGQLARRKASQIKNLKMIKKQVTVPSRTFVIKKNQDERSGRPPSSLMFGMNLAFRIQDSAAKKIQNAIRRFLACRLDEKSSILSRVFKGYSNRKRIQARRRFIQKVPRVKQPQRTPHKNPGIARTNSSPTKRFSMISTKPLKQLQQQIDRRRSPPKIKRNNPKPKVAQGNTKPLKSSQSADIFAMKKLINPEVIIEEKDESNITVSTPDSEEPEDVSPLREQFRPKMYRPVKQSMIPDENTSQISKMKGRRDTASPVLLTQNQILRSKAEKAREKEEAVKSKLEEIKKYKLQQIKEQEEEVEEIVELLTKIGPKNLHLAARVLRNYNLKYLIR